MSRQVEGDGKLFVPNRFIQEQPAPLWCHASRRLSEAAQYERYLSLADQWDKDAGRYLTLGFPYGFHLRDMAANLRNAAQALVSDTTRRIFHDIV